MGQKFDEAMRLLDSGTRNIVQSSYDDFCKKNTEFRARAGLEVVIIREAMGECCSWCSDLEGVYTYDTAPDDVYARHRECNCVVSTRTKKGTFQDAWSKKEYNTYRENRIAREQEILEEQSKVDRISLRNLFNNEGSRSRTVLQRAADNIKKITDKYAANESQWSGRIKVNNLLKLDDRITGRKKWNCDIELINLSTDADIVHEMLHSYSVSVYGKKEYIAHRWIEEASTEYLAQQICMAEGLTVGRTYAKYVNGLKKLYPYSGFKTELEYAQTLFNQPLPERTSWLKRKVTGEKKLQKKDLRIIKNCIKLFE